MHRDPAEMPDGEASGTGAEMRREQERRSVGNRSGDAAGTAVRIRSAVNPRHFFWRKEKAKKWYIKVVT